MVEFLQLFLLVLAIALSLAGLGFHEDSKIVSRVRHATAREHLVVIGIACASFLGCLAVAGILHEPIPHTPDEFSYLLMGDTLSSGHLANPSPRVPEFFETFHVLVRPVYASKYFSAQGLLLALGEKLTGHPAVGVWLSAALACAAICWMLQAWIGPTWGLLGGLLMVVQYGTYSYWSQSYWGGMVAALGGALFCGAVRRLWDRFCWPNAIWLGVGLVLLANSRPLEGMIAILPITGLFLLRILRERRWKEPALWHGLVLPAGIILLLGAAWTASYNRAITGSAWKAPYVLHDQQYMEAPVFIFLPPHPEITYSNPILETYYRSQGLRFYATERVPAGLIQACSRKLSTWWAFYCGLLLSLPLVLPGLLRPGLTRFVQIAVLAGLVILAAVSTPRDFGLRALFVVLGIIQIGLLWYVFEEFWQRVAIATLSLMFLLVFVTTWFLPHYFAPAACLVLFLQVEGLRFVWQWHQGIRSLAATAKRAERRRAARASSQASAARFRWQGLVTFLPLACVLSLGVRVAARINGWSEDGHGPDRQALLMQDWSLRKVELERWLEQQSGPQLVFVRYSRHHNINAEWVYNHADMVHSHVLWARDLGAEHNKLLIAQMPDRRLWSLEADRPEPQLAPYSEPSAPAAVSPQAPVNPDENRMDW